MSDNDYNDKSVDAVLSRIETRQIDNGEKLDKVIAKQEEQDKRIQDLEGSRKILYGVCVAIGVISPHASEWLVKTFLR